MALLKCRERQNSVNFLVLVPHRDSRIPLRGWSASLFNAGLPGAWSFPWAAPLTVLHRPLNEKTLKSLAGALRRQISKNGGKFTAGDSVSAALPAHIFKEKSAFIYGPALNITTELGIEYPVMEPVVMGSALHYGILPQNLPPPPQISFRAAAIANMCYWPLPASEYSFEWEIGKLYWLPKQK